ncbi:MAG: M15 family metallopeptidase [Clostridia bacterium]|nr:M15 family metallopeptidase [Clostridia bacterium]
MKRRKGAVSGFAVVLVVMIFVSLSLLIVRSIDWEYIFSDKTRQPFSNPDNIVYGPYITEQEHDAYLTKYVTVDADQIHRGPCILVNFDVPYIFEEDEDVYSVFKNKTKSYKVTSGSVFLRMEMINALNDMMDAFYAKTENRNIMVNSGFRNAKQQQEVYDSKLQLNGAEYAEKYVQKPGYSEHHTGYAMDLAVYDEGDLEVEGDEAMWTFDGKNEYFWVDQNCDQYGFVLRYSASKEDVTRIAYESWHYRYVGIGNALTMTNMGLSLEEYVNFIKDYSYNGTRYYITADNGDIYCTYYVKSNGQDGQKIPIPKTARSYQISGNNIDGFIIAALVGNEQQ